MQIRTNCARHALEDVILWLENGGGEVAVSITCRLLLKHLCNIKATNKIKKSSRISQELFMQMKMASSPITNSIHIKNHNFCFKKISLAALFFLLNVRCQLTST